MSSSTVTGKAEEMFRATVRRSPSGLIVVILDAPFPDPFPPHLTSPSPPRRPPLPSRIVDGRSKRVEKNRRKTKGRTQLYELGFYWWKRLCHGSMTWRTSIHLALHPTSIQPSIHPSREKEKKKSPRDRAHPTPPNASSLSVSRPRSSLLSPPRTPLPRRRHHPRRPIPVSSGDGKHSP